MIHSVARMSNKDLLKLENEYRNELPKYKEKPKIDKIARPNLLTKKVTEFLDATSKKEKEDGTCVDKSEMKKDVNVEMDIYITSM